MGIHEKLREQREKKFQENFSPKEPQEEPMIVRYDPVKVEIPLEVDRETAARIGNLAAYGLSDRDICDALLLSHEQITFARGMAEFKEAFAKQLADRQQQAIDLEEGWNLVEEKSLASVLDALRQRHDPRFALHAAYIANRAQRRTAAKIGRVIDASKAGNTIVLSLNKTYVNTTNAIQITEQKINVTTLPKKQSDILTPQRVSQLLGVKTKEQEIDELSELLEQAEIAGVHPDLIEES